MADTTHDRAWDFLSSHRQLLDGYHHHKENMANAGFIVQLSLFGAVVSPKVWPPAWVEASIVAPATSTWVVYLALWMVLHVYLRWQLQNKRIAAIFIAGIQEALLDWLNDAPSAEDLNPYGRDLPRSRGWRKLLSHFFVVPGHQVEGDLGLHNYPGFAAARVSKKSREGTGAITHEHLVTYSSWLLLVLATVRIFLG